MTRVFNTVFEVSLRIAILLELSGRPLDSEILYVADFIATYNKPFGLAHSSLQGENDFMFSEFTVRRRLANGALRELVLHGLVEPFMGDEGILFTISDLGRDYASSLKTHYANEYRLAAKRALSYIQSIVSPAVVAEIGELSLQSSERDTE